MRNDFETVMKTSSLHFSFGEVFLRSAKSKQACIPLSLSENVLCWLKESLRQASKKELVHFFEREQTSPKVTEAKERALCGGGKKSFPSRRPAGGTTQSTMQANAEAKRAWTMLSCEEKKMRSILTYSIVFSPQPCYGRRIFSFTPHVAFSDLQPANATSDIFYYHTNHLGSTAFVTDNNAIITQGFLYAPFGEITTEYNANFGYNVLPKYSFNAKELDEETGMYYYEARYYKPPVFTSRDPMFEKYFWMTPYAYCANNPVKYVDPDGEEMDDFAKDPTRYRNTKGELLFETQDGLDVDIIVTNGNIPALEKALQIAKDNGTLGDAETNKITMHVLGCTPQEYSEQATKGMDDYWSSGYRATYEKAYTEGASVPPPSSSGSSDGVLPPAAPALRCPGGCARS